MVKTSKKVIITAAVSLFAVIVGILCGVLMNMPHEEIGNDNGVTLMPTFKVDGENNYDSAAVFDFPKEMMFYQTASVEGQSGEAILVASVEPDDIDARDAGVTWSFKWEDSQQTADINEYIRMSDVADGTVDLYYNQSAKAFTALKAWPGKIIITVTTVVGGFTAHCEAIHGVTPTSVRLFSNPSEAYEQEYSKLDNGYYAMFSNDMEFQGSIRIAYLKFYNAKGEYIDASLLNPSIDSVNYSLPVGSKNSRADLVEDINTGSKYFDSNTLVTDYDNPYFGQTEGGLGSKLELSKQKHGTTEYWVLSAPNYCYTSISISNGVTIYKNYLKSGSPNIRVSVGGFMFGLGYKCLDVSGISLNDSNLDFSE